ncbi:hypothetical protein [Parashewanella tropica]|uniref:hypothetical protein n=1 Tax=Parashewanella tropica TaxID=2547970 RepID=UPI00105983AC|nr:hypothetical protein [Parashewanella tropica]
MASGGIPQYPPPRTNSYAYASPTSSDRNETVVIPPIKSTLSDEYRKGLVRYAITPLAQLETQVSSGQSTRISLLTQQAESKGITFTAAPIHPGEIFQGSRNILDPTFTKLTTSTDTDAIYEGTPISDICGEYDAEQQLMANSLLSTGHKNRCFLNTVQVPKSVLIQDAKKTQTTPWPTSTSANVTNVLILANKLNRRVIFFDPYRIDGQQFVLQQPDLTCTIGSLESLLSQFPCIGNTPPILVTSDQSHLYLFQDSEKIVKFTYHRRIKQFIDAIAQTAFSDCLGSLPESSVLAITQVGYLTRLRLVPTYEGFSLQSCQCDDFLFDTEQYLHFIFSVSQQIASQNPDPAAYRSSQGRTVFRMTHAADTEQYLITKEQLYQLETYHRQWIENVGKLRRYAIKGETEDLEEFKTLAEALAQVQLSFVSATGELKESMFTLLSHIPFNERIRSLTQPDSCIVKWFFQLQPLTEKAFPKSSHPTGLSYLPTEIIASLSRCLEQLKKFSTVHEVNQSDKALKIIETSVLQLLTLDNQGQLSDQDKNNYILPIFNQLQRLKITPAQQSTEENGFYGVVVTALAKEQQEGIVQIAAPKNAFSTIKWIRDHYPIDSLTEKQKSMLEINYEIIFDLLRTSPTEYPRALNNYLPNLQTNAREYRNLNSMSELPYGEQEISLFHIYMNTLHEKVYPPMLILQEQQHKFLNLLPVLQEEMLGRLWLSPEEMKADIQRATHATAQRAGLISGTKNKRALPWKKTASEQALVLSQSQLQVISGQLSIKLKRSGEMELRLNERKCCELTPSFLVRLRTGIGRPAHLVLTDCLSNNPKSFDRTWATHRSQPPYRKQGGWRA